MFWGCCMTIQLQYLRSKIRRMRFYFVSPAALISRVYSLRCQTISSNLGHIASIPWHKCSVAWCWAHAGVWTEEKGYRLKIRIPCVVHEDSDYVFARAFRFFCCFTRGKWSWVNSIYQHISKLYPGVFSGKFALATKPSCHVSQGFSTRNAVTVDECITFGHWASRNGD